MNKLQRSVLVVFSVLFLTSTSALKAQIVINEFSCSNLSQYLDNHSDYNDWIELYNTSATSQNLSGICLSDDSLNLTKWTFPIGTTLAGNSFLRIWASGRNESVGTTHHTNFTLKQTKNNPEYVLLSYSFGTIIDHIAITQKTQLGHSYGRTQNGLNIWSIFTTPTPGMSNNTAIPYDDYADKPDYSIGAGFYPSAVTVIITTSEPNADIRYTTDGTLPTATSTLYVSPVSITTTKTLKAKTFSTNTSILPSFVEFETYFINVSHTLPVVSIAGNSLTTLANGNSSLYPHGTFEYFNTSQVRTANTYGEFNSHGQDSWANSQRSLDFVSRDEMGYNHSIEETIFNTTPMNNFQRIILRAAGDDNYPADHHTANLGSAHVRDAYIHNLAVQGGLAVDVRRGAKCIVYLNGAYWGVYDLRDNPDDHDNTKYYYGQDKYHLYMIERWGSRWAEYGGNAALNEWDALEAYIMSNSMAVPANYQYVTDRLDVNSLVDYIAVNMFTVCSDWLNYNTAWWRGLDSTGTHLKWGYSLWDNDATFGHYINYTNIPNTNATAQPCDVEDPQLSDPDDHITILMRLRQNPTFNTYYINRLIDLWNTTFDCSTMIPALDSTVALIDPEMTAHAARWAGTYTEWQTNVQILRNFIMQRCTTLTGGFMSCWNLTGPHEMTITTDPIGAGNVQLNSLLLSQFPWTGTYFGNITTSLTASADTGYSFINWTSATQNFTPNPSLAATQINLNGGDTIVAHFLTTGLEIPDANSATVAAYPTAFNGSTTIEFTLTEASQVSLKLFNTQGKQLAEIINPGTNLPAGRHAVKLDLSKTSLSGGMYMVNFTTSDFKKSIKLFYSPN